MMRALMIGLVLTMVSGCMGTASKARPNAPADVVATFKKTNLTTGEQVEATIKATGAENPDTPMKIGVSGEGIDMNGGTSAPFDWPGVTGEPLAWAGFALILIGLALLLVKQFFPILLSRMPASFGAIAIALGFGVFLIPFVGPAVATTITICLPILVLGYAGIYAYKTMWFKNATGTEAQMDRMGKGDAGGAAVLGFLSEGGGTRGKDKAKRLKNGNGGHATTVLSPMSATAGPLPPVTGSFTHAEWPTTTSEAVAAPPTDPPA